MNTPSSSLNVSKTFKILCLLNTGLFFFTIYVFLVLFLIIIFVTELGNNMNVTATVENVALSFWVFIKSIEAKKLLKQFGINLNIKVNKQIQGQHINKQTKNHTNKQTKKINK